MNAKQPTDTLKLTLDNPTEQTMSSKNHGILQARLAGFFNLSDAYNSATELSIDVSTPERQEILKKYDLHAERELKPDVAVYLADTFDYVDPTVGIDPVRVHEIPLCCVEIVSPSQSSREITNKFKAYFDLGVKSCWYVDPNLKLLKVYFSIQTSKIFEEGEIIDPTLDIHLPVNKIFTTKKAQPPHPY